MREIKFRGTRVDNGEWVYGNFVRAWDNTCYIITEFGPDVTCCYDCGANDITAFEVISETVGQHTGLHDKNGKEIYEGDIVKVTDEEGQISELNSDTGVGAVEWVDKWGYWNVSKLENGLGDLLNTYDVRIVGKVKVKVG